VLSLSKQERDFLPPTEFFRINRFNNARGWSDNSYDLASGGAGAAEQRYQLRVVGNAGDVLTLADVAHWRTAGTVSNAGATHIVFNHRSAAAQILIGGALGPSLTGATGNDALAGGGALYYDANGTGGPGPVQFAALTGAPVLSSLDFVVT
jgi:hypothetical protein